MKKWTRKNKFQAKSQMCGLGHRHDSVAEARYCETLNLLIKAGEIKSIEYQKTFPLTVNDKKICSHRVDFVVTLPDDTQEVYEFKGFETPVWHIKKKLFEAVYPDLPYRVKTRKDIL